MFRGESRDNSVGKNRRPTLQAFHQSHGYIVSLELISNSRYPVGLKALPRYKGSTIGSSLVGILPALGVGSLAPVPGWGGGVLDGRFLQMIEAPAPAGFALIVG